MSKLLVNPNTPWSVGTQSGGNVYLMTLSSTGALQVPGTVSFKVGSYNGTFTHSNTADRIYTLPDRAGTVALVDNASLLAMLPTISGQGGKFLYTDGSTVSWANVPSASLTSFNGISTSTYQTQTLAIGTSGTAPNWVSQNSNTNTHTLNIPMASTASVTAGLLSNTDYSNIPFKNNSNTFGGTQTFTNAPIITTPSTNANAAATVGQVQTATAGLSIRPPVAAINTASTTLPTANPVIDGYTVQLNDRVLFTALSTNAGRVYKATSSLSSVVWTLETDGQAGTGAPSDGDILFIKNGTTYHDQQWAYNGAAWVQYNVAQSYTFSTGLNQSGTTITVVYGTTAGTSCQGNDSRLSDSRTPIAHQLDGALHTISGKTPGQVLIATSATTFAFVSFTGDVSVSAAGATVVNNINSVPVASLGLAISSANLTDNMSTATASGIQFPTATTRNVRIDFSLSRGTGNYACGYIVLLYDGTNARITYCEDDSVGTHGVTFTADVNGGNIRLLYQTTSTGTAGVLKYTTNIMPQ